MRGDQEVMRRRSRGDQKAIRRRDQGAIITCDEVPNRVADGDDGQAENRL